MVINVDNLAIENEKRGEINLCFSLIGIMYCLTTGLCVWVACVFVEVIAD